MKTRLLFAVTAGVSGAILGGVVAWIVRAEAERFPWHVVTAFAVIFGACGALARRRWVEAVRDFFLHVV